MQGNAGIPELRAKVKANGVKVFYHGALAASTATFVGHYPWFATHNYLNEKLPKAESLEGKLFRNAT